MNIESFIEAHPMAYVHIAYSVVWLLHFGFVLWIVAEWRKTPDVKKATGPARMPDPVVPRSHA